MAEFWDMTWNEYYRRCEGFRHREELEWERTRYISHLIYNSAAKHPKKPQELVPLNLDKKQKSKSATTQNDVARILEKYRNKLIPINGEQ